LGDKAFPPAAHELFNRLGIDYRQPAEKYHNGRLGSGFHSYGGWFAFVGVYRGDDAQIQSRGPGRVQVMEYFSAGANFMLHCGRQSAPIQKAFAGKDLAELTFYADLPWVIAEPEEK
jgi:hypothetical protein